MVRRFYFMKCDKTVLLIKLSQISLRTRLGCMNIKENTMSTSNGFRELSPDLVKKLIELSMMATPGTLGAAIYGLVDIRASQLNGCGFCLDMHVKAANIQGESTLRLLHVPIWRESSLFNEREKAALLWTELLTKLDGHGISEDDRRKVSAQLTEKEMSDLAFKVGIINSWNRLNVAFPTEPGSMDNVYGLSQSRL